MRTSGRWDGHIRELPTERYDRWLLMRRNVRNVHEQTIHRVQFVDKKTTEWAIKLV